MEIQSNKMGRVRPVPEGEHNAEREYRMLSIVYSNQTNKSYISKQDVPVGINIDNKNYWQVFGNGKFVDNAIINVSYLEDSIVPHTLAEAISMIDEEDRRPGIVIAFFEKHSDINKENAWILYQFKGSSIDDWDKQQYWTSVYNRENKFKGWFLTSTELVERWPYPYKGDYAYVGQDLVDSWVWRCDTDGTWVKTSEKSAKHIEINYYGDIVNNPDLEDIDVNSQNKLKFADRNFGDNEFGYVILRKNKTFVEQVNKENTIYEIRYSFDLNNNSVIIPNNCILNFKGGSIINGTLIGTNTKIIANKEQIFNLNINFDGYFDIINVYPEWFGAKGLYYNSSNEATQPTGLVLPNEADNLIDAAPAINKAFDLSRLGSGIAIVQKRIYRIETTVTIPAKCVLKTQEDTIFDVRMHGSGENIVVQNEDTSNFSTESVGNRISLLPNEFFDSASMAKAFSISPVKAALVGRGVITLINSTHTIGVFIPGTGYQYLDMSYESPYIDIRTVGGRFNSVAPDTRDLNGNGIPSSELGNEGEYYFDKQNNKYYKKTSGNWIEQYSSNVKENLFNTSLRIDVGQGWSSGRIIRPKIRIWDMYGWRGIEIYTHNGGWCNDGFWEGTVSNKHGSFVSIFTNYDVTQHDFSEITCQFDALIQNDCRGFYAIRCGNIKLPRFWDLSWIQPPRANTTIGEKVIYLGKYTSYCSAILDAQSKYFTDFGTTNNSNFIKQDYTPNSFGASESINTLGFVNLFKYRTPKCAGAFQQSYTPNNYKLITTLYNNIKALLDVEPTTATSSENVEPPVQMFDGSDESYATLIDCNNGIYGCRFLIGQNNTKFDPVENQGYIAIRYRAVGANVPTGKLFAFIYNTNRAVWSEATIQLSGNASGNMRTAYLPVRSYSYGNWYLFIFITEHIENAALSVYSIEYYLKGRRLGVNNGEMYGPTSYLPNAAPYGTIYFDTQLNLLKVNKGSSVEPDWNIIESSLAPKAKFVNASPGNPMTWRNSDNIIVSSEETVIESSDVRPITKSLFKSNTTIKKIEYYPINKTPGATLESLFHGCTNLEEIPFVYTSGVTNFELYCAGTKIKEFPLIDMSSATNASNIFNSCTLLETIPLLDWKNIVYTTNTFKNCTNLKNVAGFKDLAVGIYLAFSPNLTRESVLNIFNNIADISGRTTQNISLHSTVYDLLSAADIAIATNKGWTVTRV